MSERNGKSGFPPRTMARNVGGFAHDLLALTELQTELIKVDAQDCLKRMIAPVVILLSAFALVLGCVPVGLTALAYGFVTAGFENWLAFLLATGIGLGVAIVAGLVGWQLLRKSPAVFERSKDEFNSNFRWVKQVLTNDKAS